MEGRDWLADNLRNKNSDGSLKSDEEAKKKTKEEAEKRNLNKDDHPPK